jgi:hypothetical protein
MPIKVFTEQGDSREFDETDMVGAVAYAARLAKASPEVINAIRQGGAHGGVYSAGNLSRRVFIEDDRLKQRPKP